MKEKTKKIINICGAIGIACAFLIGVCNSVTNKAVPLKAKANNNNDIVLNTLIDRQQHYLMPYESIDVIKLQNDNLPYELSTLNDNDYTPVVYVVDVYNSYDIYLILRNLAVNEYNCFTKLRTFAHSSEGIDDVMTFNSLWYNDISIDEGEISFLDDDSNELDTYYFMDEEYSQAVRLIFGVSVRDNSRYHPFASDLIRNARVYNADALGGIIDAEYGDDIVYDYIGDSANQHYYDYNIYPRVTLPKDLKNNEYYLGEHALYLNYPYKRCEYSGVQGMRYYVIDETGNINFNNPSISPNGKNLSFLIDNYNVVHIESQNKYVLHYIYGKSVNMITFIPTLENVLFYKYQGFKAYGNNGAYANEMPNIYFAFRNLQWTLSGQQSFWLDIYTQYNGIYYDSVYADAYFHDYGRQLIFKLYNDNSNLIIYQEIVEYVYGEVNANKYNYETQLSNYVINVINQPYTQDVYDFIAFYTAYEVDENIIVTNPITNITTSTDGVNDSGVFDLLGSAFNGIYSAFNVMVFPGVTLWALLMIPLVGVILLFIIKLFKR